MGIQEGQPQFQVTAAKQQEQGLLLDLIDVGVHMQKGKFRSLSFLSHGILSHFGALLSSTRLFF